MAKRTEAEWRRSIERIGKARSAIIKHCQNQRGVAGKLKCPVCETGTLQYSRASNGHVHAGCSTKGCVNWME